MASPNPAAAALWLGDELRPDRGILRRTAHPVRAADADARAAYALEAAPADAFKAQALRLLAAAIARGQRHRIALVCTMDGLLYGVVGATETLQAQRLAAMTAALLSVSGRAAIETGGTHARELLIGTDGAHLVMHALTPEFGLCVVAEARCPPGVLLSNSRRLAAELTALFSSPGAG